MLRKSCGYLFCLGGNCSRWLLCAFPNPYKKPEMSKYKFKMDSEASESYQLLMFQELANHEFGRKVLRKMKLGEIICCVHCEMKVSS